MPLYRMQVSIAADSVFPRDRLVMTPHFDDHGATSDPDGLCEDLAEAIRLWSSFTTTREFRVTAYDARGTKPVFPAGSAVKNVGLASASSVPRELALCLSYYSGQNVPRKRGRLYVPACMWKTTGSVGVRPDNTDRDEVGQLVPHLTGLGGADVDWVVYSRVDDEAYPVTNWWVDDEWDIVRSRGLRGTVRTAGTVSE